MKRNWLLYLVIFSLALNVGTIGTIVYHRYQEKTHQLARELPPPMGMRGLWGALKLDEAQRQEVRGLFPAHRAKVTELRGELFQKRQELLGLIKGESPAMNAVQAKVREISDLQGKLEEEMVRFQFEFRKQLKPEQRAVFLEQMQTRWDKALGGPPGYWGRRGPKGGGPHGRMGPGPDGGPPPPGTCPPPGAGPGPGGSGCPE